MCLVVMPAMARDNGQYDQTTPRAQWFRSLERPDMRPAHYGCCSEADCREVETRIVSGHYEVKIEGVFYPFPDEKIERDPEILKANPTGSAVACWLGWPNNAHESKYINWYCLEPWDELT